MLPRARVTGELTPYEVSTGIVLGQAGEKALRRSRPLEPLAAFEAALLGPLRRPPCLVAFSGVDSSAVLAVAAGVARREGLLDPVPATNRFPGAPQTAEDEWQERTVTSLGLKDWLRVEHGDELDLVGPEARTVLTGHGVLYPYNLHMFAALMRAAAGGSLVTGFAGDQIFTPASRVLGVLGRRVRPQRRDLLRIAGATAPRRVRVARNRRLYTMSFPWLTAEANAELDDRVHVADSYFPLWWNARARAMARARYVRLVIRHMAAVGAGHDAMVAHPFVDDGFVNAVAHAGGRTGFRNRADALAELLGDAVPAELLTRTTKATFDEVLWARHTRAFVEGLDEERLSTALRALEVESLVDAGALLSHWSEPGALTNSYLLLQGAWLALEATRP
jgi:hypothetical protein